MSGLFWYPARRDSRCVCRRATRHALLPGYGSAGLYGVPVRPSPYLLYAICRIEQEAGGKVAQGDYHCRIDFPYLGFEEWPAGGNFLLERVTVVGGPALDDIGYVALGSHDAQFLLHEPVQQLTGLSHERLSRDVLVSTRSFSYKHQICAGVADPEYDIGPAAGQPACSTVCSFPGE